VDPVKPDKGRCVCGGGKTHHAIEEECWCPGCLLLPESSRCKEFRPVIQPGTRPAPSTARLPRAGTMKRTVYDLIRRHRSCTDDDLEYLTGRSHQSVSACRNSLVAAGLVEDSGQTKVNRYGNDAVLWRATIL